MGGEVEDAEQGMPNKGRKSVHWRRDPEILARMVKVERRHLAGEPNTAIAATLNVDETTIRRDVERIRELWRERTAMNLEEMKAQKVAELEDVKRRALEQAEFDHDAESAVLYGKHLDGFPSIVRRDDRGGVHFRGNKAGSLAQARQAIMDQAKVLGLVVDKVAPTDSKGNDLDLASLLQKARELRATHSEDAGVGTDAE